VQGWLKTVDIDTVLVVSDVVAKDVMQQTLMTMAMPSSVKLYIKNLKDATNAVINGQYAKKKVMILTMNPSDVLYMIENGAVFKSINIGGMHFINGKRQLLYNFCVDDNDVKNLYKICSKGIEIDGRVLPGDTKTSIVPVIEKEYQALSKAVK
jgi:mannose/fructose/N-acetylgalactosamine-specific phosphotransferase system component IIB